VTQPVQVVAQYQLIFSGGAHLIPKVKERRFFKGQRPFVFQTAIFNDPGQRSKQTHFIPPG
jgi:hypothetical protein